MQEEHRTLRTSDGVRLSYTCWADDLSAPIHRIVAMLPGIGLHSGPYHTVAASLDLPDCLYAALDFRGHGLSEGPRGEMGGPGRVEQDIAEWVAELHASAPDAHMVLIAESMGSAYGLRFGLHHSKDLSGLVIIGPALAPSPQQVLSLETIHNVTDFVRRPSLSEPYIDISGRRLEAGTRDQDFIALRRTDPLVLKKVSVGYLAKVVEAILSVNLRAQLEFSCPVYIAHGARDHVIDPLEARVLFFRIKAPAKELQVIPEAYHTLFWDPASGELFSRLRRWVLDNTQWPRTDIRATE